MSTQYTTPYALPYPQSGDEVRLGYSAIEGIAKKVNDVLVAGSFPSSIPDVYAITTRLDALESKPFIYVERNSTDLSLGTSGAEQAFGWSDKFGDVSTMTSGSFPSRLIAPKAGWYKVDATLVLSNTSGGLRSVGFQAWNGGVKKFYRGQDNTAPSASFYASLTSSLSVYLAAGDYVVVVAEVQSAAATTYVKASQGTRASMAFIRP